MSGNELSCRELVEIVTEYLEGGLSESERTRFEEHLEDCEGCANHLDQIRVTISLTHRVTPDDICDETKSQLLEAFRDWKRA